MDARNWELIGLGEEEALWKFASLPIEKAAAEGFCRDWGELYPGVTPRECLGFVKVFQWAWRATTDDEKESVSQNITAIFERDTSLLRRLPPFKRHQAPAKSGEIAWGGLPNLDDPGRRPAVVADFTTGTVTVKPRTLLDWLAKWLLQYRDSLAICERKGCTTAYYVKTHPRQRFCTPKCADSARQQKKKQWWAENRERFIQKWRQQRKAAKRGKGKQTKAGHARRSGQTRP